MHMEVVYVYMEVVYVYMEVVCMHLRRGLSGLSVCRRTVYACVCIWNNE